MGSSIRYCIIALVPALLIISAVMIVNAVVDPFGMFRLVDWPGVNSRKPAIYQRVRLLKSYEARSVKAKAIVLGTSRSHIGLRMTHPGWAASPRYNLAFDGATTHEMHAYLVHAQSLQPLTQVVLGLDTWHLSSPRPIDVRPSFDPGVLLASPSAFSKIRVADTDLRILASIETLQASLRTVREQDSNEPEWLAPDGQRLGDAFFRRAGELFHDQSPRAYFEAYDRQEIEWQKPPPFVATPERIDDSSLKWIYRIVDFCRANRIDLRIYITPLHAHQLEMTIANGDWKRLERAKRELVRYLAEDATRYPHQPPISLWDFSGYSPVTTESPPPPGSRAEMCYYWDSSHFKEMVGDLVLDRVLGGSMPYSSSPPNFGVLLTTQTIDAALKNTRAARADYIKAHATEVAEIHALVAQSRAAIPRRQAQDDLPTLAAR